MRTGNGQKTENQNRVRAWKNNKKLPIELIHLEIDLKVLINIKLMI